MRIGEVAEKTGLSISNIRFYEKKGLIGPEREAESKYRNYTEEDFLRIQQIILLRKMDISVETIGKLLENEITMEDVLEQQLLDLKNKQMVIQGSIDLCQKMIADQAFDEVDVNYYNDYVKEEEANGTQFAKIDDFIDDFSNFTRYDYFMGWHIFPYHWMNRVARGVWCAIFILAPILCIVDDIWEGEQIGFLHILFLVAWFMAFGLSFMVHQSNRER